MSDESTLIASLKTAATTLYNLVGVRIEPAPRRLSQTVPDITWHVVTRTFEQPLTRAVTGRETHYQFDIWDDDVLGCEAVAAALKTALLAFTTGTHCLTIVSEFDLPEPEDPGLSHRALTVAILT
jgi:hypothetical protein